MQINDLKAAKKDSKKRVGRGGKKGTYSGAGMNGQKSRSGHSQAATFTGGSSAIVGQTKKLRGFKSLNPKAQVVNIKDVERVFSDGDEVTPETLKEKGLISKLHLPVKILSVGEISKKISFKDIAFSVVAKTKIEKAGGSVA
ncbi:50S ribosomal protein L15 [bacterium]|jgi:large subunit ribosomal protein L15|nr:50S ribosomal protein L15 [bacterium]MBT4251554.1 50S ribosomal protein L15 [bacterium]MBT4597816.1 50S ribosomal protein L15 [bacterium]MBT6753540.1 50S ribosomal protein L15 [bacterium]MBT7037732.1 50S ribosomal protein L15 [bacterium]